jgi:hypothetical protein
MNDQNCLLLIQIAIEDHVLGKAGNEYPAQSYQGRSAKTAQRSTFWEASQGVHYLTYSFLPPMR